MPGDRRGDHQRDRGGRTDRELTRASEKRITDAAAQVAVDADLRRQTGQRRIGERHRDRIGSECHARDGVLRQPFGVILGQPADGRQYSRQTDPVDRSLASVMVRALRHQASQSTSIFFPQPRLERRMVAPHESLTFHLIAL
jgi:hypothetical protein